VSVRLHYVLKSFNRPILTLGGRFSRPQPLVPVTLIGPGNSNLVEGLLDSGAEDTVFPEYLAARVGLDLTNAPTGSATGVGGPPIPLRYAEVSLRIAGAQELREWRAWVGFTTVALRRPLLGFAGFLQFFTATFHGDLEEVELTINSLYPGT
jgi:hypothetical protein